LKGLFDGRRLVVYSGNSVGDGGSDNVEPGGVAMWFDMVIVLSLSVKQREAAAQVLKGSRGSWNTPGVAGRAFCYRYHGRTRPTIGRKELRSKTVTRSFNFGNVV